MKLTDFPPGHFRAEGSAVQTISFPYRRSADQDAAAPVRHPVVIVGAGPVGLTLAIDLAQRGQPVVVLDNDHKLSTGSRALCFAKRTLEIWDRLGVGQPMVDKGVSWNVGKVFFRDEQVYGFNLLPEDGHERPAFINLQQYYAEAHLVERALQFESLDIRWHNTVSGITPQEDGATLKVSTPEGDYTLQADWVLACDGSRSPLRGLMGLESKGRIFRDRFLIADVKMEADFPTERWFWFDPPFHPNQSVLLHREPDNVWRIDFQLGWDADPEEEKKPERILPRVQALLGPDVKFTLEWASVYTFACQRMERFVHGHVIFAGDAAHGVSPFGARGANSGVQDADNLAWKLDWVLRGRAPAALIHTYGPERECAADENILNSTRATDFITPKSPISKLFRNQVLELAREHEFARRLVNSGRLSVPATLHGSSLNTPDVDRFEGPMVPGAPLTDAPVTRDARATWLLRELAPGFTLLVFGAPPTWAAELREWGVTPLAVSPLPASEGPASEGPAPDSSQGHDPLTGLELVDHQGLVAQRLDARPGTAYLIRPDQHVCARWRRPTLQAVQAALKAATAQV